MSSKDDTEPPKLLVGTAKSASAQQQNAVRSLGSHSDTIDIGRPKDGEKEEKAAGMSAYVALWRYTTPFDTCLRVCGFFAAVAAGTALPLMTIVFGKLADDFNGWGTGTTTPAELRSAVSRNALWFVYLFVGKLCLVYIHTCCFTITALRSTRMLRLEYVRAILRQDMAYFDSYTPGSVATRISNNANLIQAGLSEKVGTVIQGVAMLVSAFVVAFSQSWRLTLPVATTIPTAVVLVAITVVMDAKLEAKVLDIYSKAGGLVEETLGSIRIVVAFGANKKLEKKYDKHLETAAAIGKKRGPVLGVQYCTGFFVLYCAYALAFWYGIRLLLKGQIGSGGQILTVLFSVVIGTTALTSIAPSIGEFTKAGAAANDLLHMIAKEPDIDSMSPEGLKPQLPRGEFKFTDVSFSYSARPTVQVLDKVTLEIPAQKVTALVGASGCGKSTIVGLLERWYDPAQGMVSMDGEDIRNLNLRWLRSKIGLEPILFNDTIYNNVVYGLHDTEMDNFSEEKKRELVREACIESDADEFIQKLPKGYDTNVGERGSLLSGGQRQRVAIARSIISDPLCLLLDEATSALDPKAEAIVQAALDHVSRSRTTVLIAHKLATVKKADNIIVMSKGRVMEQGTHESLLSTPGGAYYNLVKAQNLSLAIDDDDDEKEDSSSDREKESGVAADLEKVATTTRSTRSNVANSEAVVPELEDVSRKLSLFRCLLIIFYEQRRLWVLFLFGALASIGSGGAFPAQAVLFARLITTFQLPEDRMIQDRGNFWALMFFVLALSVLVCYASIGFSMTVAGYIVSRFYRVAYFSAMLAQDVAFFDHADHSSAALTARLSTDPQHLQDLISGNMSLILIVIVNLLSSCLLALVVGWKLALVAIFACLPAIFAAGFTRMRMEITSQDRNARLYLESARFASEAVAAIRTVSSLTLESKVYDRYAQSLRGPVLTSYRHTLISMVFFALSDTIDMAAMALAFWYGGVLLSKGEYDAQQFFTIFIAIIFSGQAAGVLFGFTLNTTKAHASANQILHLRSQIAPINGSTGGDPMTTLEGKSSSGDDDDDDVAIEFKDVTFHYPNRPDHAVLRNLNFTIHRGQSVGLVGPSGCGKTTIIALLERFYDVTSGQILIDGRPLTSLDVRSYRESTGLVSQETTLYQGSIRENVTLGLPFSPSSSTVTDNDDNDNDNDNDRAMIQACQDANLHDFIVSLPDGYDTDCGSRGLAFSGGQRQRLATARALLRNPRILLLDEATSALDTESERVVQAALEQAARGRTTISVAHRLSTVQECHRLFVLDQGRIVESGSHGDLLRRRGRYFEMCQAQSLDRQGLD